MNTDKHDLDENDRLVRIQQNNSTLTLNKSSILDLASIATNKNNNNKSTKSSNMMMNPAAPTIEMSHCNSPIETRKNNSAPLLYLNKSQVLADTNIKISDDKLDTSVEKRIDLEANLIYDNSFTSLKSANKSTHQSVSDKLKNVGKIISDKFSNKIKSSKMNIAEMKNGGEDDEVDDDDDDDDDDDYTETYDENYFSSNDNDYKISTDKNNKIDNAVLYEENDEDDDVDEEDDNLVNIHSDLEEKTYFINESKKICKSQPQQQVNQHQQQQQQQQPPSKLNLNVNKIIELKVPMASPDVTSTTSNIDNNNCENKINFQQHQQLTDAKAISSNLLMPIDINLNASSNSATSKSSSLNNRQSVSFNQTTIGTNLIQQPPNSLRNLKKMTTQGSKAMRIMGNDNITSSNGPLSKMNSSDDANNLKASSVNTNLINSNLNGNKKLQQKRLFFKNGNINISRSNIDKRRRRYLTDIFTTLIDLKWRYNALVFALGFFVSWIFFAILWYLISYFHSDLEIVNLENKNYTACVAGISSFSGAILFSIETQQTIGYGVRYTTEKCPLAIFVMMLQSSMGVIIQSFMVGVVFAKLSRPKKRSETLMFSKNAVISLRDGRLCLICRVGDMRKSHIVEAHVRMYLIKKKVTLEGEIMPLHMYDLNVGWDKGLDRLFLVWPLTIEHYIDQNSPFWNLSAEDLKKERFEIAVILEGIVESTGMTTQARSSYLVNEILWGHRFEKLITFQKEDGTYKIDYSRFNMTVPVDTPTCSAKDLADLKEQEQFYSEVLNENSNSPSTLNSKEIVRSDDLDSFNASYNDLRRRKLDTKDDLATQTNTNSSTNQPINKQNEMNANISFETSDLRN